MLNTQIAGRGRAPINLMQITHRRAEGASDSRAAVSRAVVNHNDLGGGQGLVQCALDDLSQIALAIVDGDDGGDGMGLREYHVAYFDKFMNHASAAQSAAQRAAIGHCWLHQSGMYCCHVHVYAQALDRRHARRSWRRRPVRTNPHPRRLAGGDHADQNVSMI